MLPQIEKPATDQSQTPGERPVTQIVPPAQPRGLHAARERGIEPVPWEVQLREMQERQIQLSAAAEAAKRPKSILILGFAVLLLLLIVALLVS